MAQIKKSTEITDEEKPFDQISFTDLALHTLLDMFEFSVHSFEGVGGPYFWNGVGIDFESPMPKGEVLAHAKSVSADTVYVAHTHPLSNDDSFKFLNVKIDPREKVAFGYKPLPLGSKPSSGDVSFFSQLKKEFADASVNIVGVVFSASGIWEYDIPNIESFDADKFVKMYDDFYPINDGGDFMKEWSARGDFPNYYMELQKPKMHQKAYKTQITEVKSLTNIAPKLNEEVSRATDFFNANGVTLTFYPYTKFGIDPQSLMRRTLVRWTDTFAQKTKS